MKDIDKLIVTNKSRLLEKYKTAGWKKIQAALNRLIATDKKRGLDTKLVLLDAPGRHAVKQFDDERQNKTAIDHWYDVYSPDYLVLLGSRDVVPHVRLKNEIPPDEDEDVDDLLVNSDLPYACAAGFSRKMGDFLSPSRVVGRLPDITGGSNVDDLLRVIDTATIARPRPRSEYTDYFALTALVWSGSTRMTLRNVFGDADRLLLCPPHPLPGEYAAPQLQSKIHFFNCHGGRNTAHFFGQRGEDFPESFFSHNIPDKLSEGTVAAAECCYGADLFNPVGANGQVGIGNNYLLHGALAYVGSTTVAFGRFRTQENADLLTEFFLKNVLKGFSTGRAFLEARQKYIRLAHDNSVDPYELKTIAQFILLGDPSVQPVIASARAGGMEDDVKMSGKGHVHEKLLRRSRRISMTAEGIMLEVMSNPPKFKKSERISPKVSAALKKVLKQQGFPVTAKPYVYVYTPKSIAAELNILFRGQKDVRLYAYSHRPKNKNFPQASGVLKEMLAIKTIAGEIVEIRKYVGR